MNDLHDLRVGDTVLREMDVDDGIERHVGEVLSIRARIRYIDVGYRWAEWWDVTTGALWPFKPEDVPEYRLRPATSDEIDRLKLR